MLIPNFVDGYMVKDIYQIFSPKLSCFGVLTSLWHYLEQACASESIIICLEIFKQKDSNRE